jgi:hypothetical protein
VVKEEVVESCILDEETMVEMTLSSSLPSISTIQQVSLLVFAFHHIPPVKESFMLKNSEQPYLHYCCSSKPSNHSHNRRESLRVVDPGTGDFLTLDPGSWIPTHVFDSLMIFIHSRSRIQ